MKTDISSIPANIRKDMANMSPEQRKEVIDYFRRNDEEEIRLRNRGKEPIKPAKFESNPGMLARVNASPDIPRKPLTADDYSRDLLDRTVKQIQQSKPRDPIDKALDVVLTHEGGYQANSKDKGNYTSTGYLAGTNHGISARLYEQVTGTPPTAEDMKKLTKEEARTIYKSEFVEPVQRNLKLQPDNALFVPVVDMAVNHGYQNAVKILQDAAGITVDGLAGPETRRAISKVTPTKLAKARKKFYYNIVKENPTQVRFLPGWIKRAESFAETKVG